MKYNSPEVSYVNFAFALLIVSPIASFGCSSTTESTSTADTGDAGSSDVGGETPAVGGVGNVEIPCTDAIVETFAAPAKLAGVKGTILKCAKDVDVTAETLNADAKREGYVGKTFTSGAKVYRVSYVTERATNPVSIGFGSAVVYLPDTPAAAKGPAVVVAHGTGGQGSKCAPSQDPNGMGKGGMLYMVRPLVGMGMPVIVPDYAGFAAASATNPPSGYAHSADVGRSALDAARALRLLVPSKVSDQVVMVGHSQGGHTVLSALAMAEAYAPELKMAAVVAYAPLWLTQLSWGAILGVPSLFPMKTSAFVLGVNVWYHYSHAELLDGPGKGAELFAPSKRDAIKNFFENKCEIDESFTSLGENIGALFDPALPAAVGGTALSGEACTNSDPKAKALCETWMARYKSDRPHLTGKAAAVPILVLQGDKDETIGPDRAMCAFDRLHADRANVTICVQTGAAHIPVVYETSGYASAWIAAKVFGAPEPAKCDRDEKSLATACATPPPNDKD